MAVTEISLYRLSEQSAERYPTWSVVKKGHERAKDAEMLHNFNCRAKTVGPQQRTSS